MSGEQKKIYNQNNQKLVFNITHDLNKFWLFFKNINSIYSLKNQIGQDNINL